MQIDVDDRTERLVFTQDARCDIAKVLFDT
jgi:hypothetical protein